jgi:hydroxyethylthiazole kinase-like uncharacterized protein yjeF
MTDGAAAAAFVPGVLRMFADATVLLDALAMDSVPSLPRLAQSVILTPHAGEMAHLTGMDKDEVLAQPQAAATRQSADWGAVLALKGASTCVAHPDGRCWRHESRTPGLATSGSGDVLAGIIAGLAARGAPPEQAAVWGVALHARAGQRLARRTGSVGYLARDLSSQVPALMHALAPD